LQRQSELAKVEKRNEDEKTLWYAIRYSGSINEFESFLRLYPSGQFASQAKEAIAAAKAIEDQKAIVASKTIETPRAVVAKTRERSHPADIAKLSATIERLKPLHQSLGKPRPGDWLDVRNESGQTFKQYLGIRPVTPTGRRTIIYLQPLGRFTKDQRLIVVLSAEYLEIYMNRPVKILGDLPLSIIPPRARRTHPVWKVNQILSTYVLDEVLKPRLPDDAASYIAFTAADMWPGQDWDAVEGLASLRDRVAVLSIVRNGNASARDEPFQLCLRRTLKTATHETGHMFSMRHCIAYECNMCGSTGHQESDRYPSYLCPECHAKVCWATGTEPVKRYRRLAVFCMEHGLDAELAYYMKAAAALSP
jgi:archaemetzincin